MREIPCPHCGEWLGIPPEFANRPVRCGSCQKVISPGEHSPHSNAPLPPPTAPTPARARYDDDEAYRPERKPRGKIWLWLLLGFGGLSLLCCGGGAVIAWRGMNPKWQEFRPEGGEFAAIFPGKPKLETKPFNWPNGTTGTARLYHAERMGGPAGFHVHFLDIPKTQLKGSEDFLLNAMIEEIKKSDLPSFAEVSRKPVSGTNYEGKEVEATFQHPKHGTGIAFLRIAVVGERIFVLMALGKDRKRLLPEKDRFFDSFVPTLAVEKK